MKKKKKLAEALTPGNGQSTLEGERARARLFQAELNLAVTERNFLRSQNEDLSVELLRVEQVKDRAIATLDAVRYVWDAFCNEQGYDPTCFRYDMDQALNGES